MFVVCSVHAMRHPRQRIIGVMALVVTVEYMATMLKDTYELCKLEGFM